MRCELGEVVDGSGEDVAVVRRADAKSRVRKVKDIAGILCRIHRCCVTCSELSAREEMVVILAWDGMCGLLVYGLLLYGEIRLYKKFIIRSTHDRSSMHSPQAAA